MPETTASEIEGLEYDWLARDEDGNVALFSTAGRQSSYRRWPSDRNSSTKSRGSRSARVGVAAGRLLVTDRHDGHGVLEPVGSAQRSREVGTTLLPLGEVDGGHAFLAVGASGEVFMLMDGFWSLGGSIEEALTRLIEGLRAREIDS